MENKNLSVFGNVLRNDEIAGFIRLVNLTRDIFHQELTTLEIMPGGLTNKNFRTVTEDGTQVAIRLAGAGTANYINRPGEKQNATQMASIGIAPEIYYYDPTTGSQIVEYIDAPTMHPEDFQTRDEVLNKAGRVMRRYHDSGMEFKTSFNPISKIEEYKAIMAEHKYEKRYRGFGQFACPEHEPCRPRGILGEDLFYCSHYRRAAECDSGPCFHVWLGPQYGRGRRVSRHHGIPVRDVFHSGVVLSQRPLCHQDQGSGISSQLGVHQSCYGNRHPHGGYPDMPVCGGLSYQHRSCPAAGCG